MQRIPWSFGLALGLALGFVVAARNSSGTYSLTSGNPVVAGTTITASNENAFRADVAAEITDSLSRSGKGGMTASLKLSNGTSSAPAWAFTSDTNTGMYRTGSDAIALVCGATTAQTWASTGAIFPLVATANAGLVVTNSAGVDGIVATGSGVGRAIVATGGGTSAAGISTTGGASNGRGIEATGDGTGMGVFATGGDSSGAGISATGGAPNGIGGVFTGTGTGAAVSGTGSGTAVGGTFANGTSGTGTTPQNAVTLTNGNLSLVGVVSPNSDVAILNTLAPSNIIKAWGRLTPTGGGATTVAVNSGFNIATTTVATGAITVNLASAFTSTGYAVLVTSGFGNEFCAGTVVDSDTFTINCYPDQASGTPYDYQGGGGTHNVSFLALGIQ